VHLCSGAQFLSHTDTKARSGIAVPCSSKIPKFTFLPVYHLKEINDIITAFHAANNAGLKTALATVVRVEGSSYRQPGARMLVTETGQLTGAISGGCLEGDALRRALLSIEQQQNKLVTYDTSNEDDIEFGVQLGCNGIVHILFEPLDYLEKNNPIFLLEQLVSKRENAVMVILFSLDRSKSQPGTALLYREQECFANSFSLDADDEKITTTLTTGSSLSTQWEIDGNNIEALIEFIPPPVRLVIAGAGNDVKPLVDMGALLGWELIIADGRKTHATHKRFPNAKEVLVIKAAELTNAVSPDRYTVYALMTHNYNYDLEALKILLTIDPVYIGILGPRKKFDRMLNDLANDQINITAEQLEYIHTPIGLDIGAETSEEIAVSILAEIKAVLSGRKGMPLKLKTEKIHA
jgi:xanthine dehydrogenase accessory factor